MLALPAERMWAISISRCPDRLRFQGEWDARFKKEKAEYDDAVNKQDAVEKVRRRRRNKAKQGCFVLGT